MINKVKSGINKPLTRRRAGRKTRGGDKARGPRPLPDFAFSGGFTALPASFPLRVPFLRREMRNQMTQIIRAMRATVAVMSHQLTHSSLRKFPLRPPIWIS